MSNTPTTADIIETSYDIDTLLKLADELLRPTWDSLGGRDEHFVIGDVLRLLGLARQQHDRVHDHLETLDVASAPSAS